MANKVVKSTKPRGRLSKATKPSTHACAVCHSRKHDADYPFKRTSTERSFVTCTECLQKSAGDKPYLWNDLGLTAPAEPTASNNASVGPRKRLRLARLGETDVSQGVQIADATNGRATAQREVQVSTEAGDGMEDGAEDEDENGAMDWVDEGNAEGDDNEEADGDASNSPMPKRRRRRARSSWWTQQRRAKAKYAALDLSPPTEFTCRVCCEDKPVDDFIKYIRSRPVWLINSTEVPFACVKHLSRPRSRKRHEDPICKECIARTMAADLQTKGPERIGCPDCSVRWDTPYVLRYLAPEHHDEYHEGLFKLFWNRAYKLTCPNKECGALGFVDHQRTPGFPHVECFTCKGRACVLCEAPWHEGITCQQFRAKNRNHLGIDKAEMESLRQLAKIGARRCPRCQMAIEKNGGCESMYCFHCQRYFYWNSAEPVLGVKDKSIYNREASRKADYYSEVCELDSIRAHEHKKAADEKARAAARSALLPTGIQGGGPMNPFPPHVPRHGDGLVFGLPVPPPPNPFAAPAVVVNQAQAQGQAQTQAQARTGINAFPHLIANGNNIIQQADFPGFDFEDPGPQEDEQTLAAGMRLAPVVLDFNEVVDYGVDYDSDL